MQFEPAMAHEASVKNGAFFCTFAGFAIHSDTVQKYNPPSKTDTCHIVY